MFDRDLKIRINRFKKRTDLNLNSIISKYEYVHFFSPGETSEPKTSVLFPESALVDRDKPAAAGKARVTRTKSVRVARPSSGRFEIVTCPEIEIEHCLKITRRVCLRAGERERPTRGVLHGKQ